MSLRKQEVQFHAWLKVLSSSEQQSKTSSTVRRKTESLTEKTVSFTTDRLPFKITICNINFAELAYILSNKISTWFAGLRFGLLFWACTLNGFSMTIKTWMNLMLLPTICLTNLLNKNTVRILLCGPCDAAVDFSGQHAYTYGSHASE